MQALIVLGLLIAILAVTFALQNPGVMVVKFLAWEFSGSMALVLIVTFALGFVASFLIASATQWHRKTKGKGEKGEEPPEAPSVS